MVCNLKSSSPLGCDLVQIDIGAFIKSVMRRNGRRRAVEVVHIRKAIVAISIEHKMNTK
jgi:hypothetical protein